MTQNINPDLVSRSHKESSKIAQQDQALKKFAALLDSAIKLPGTSIRIGIDSLIGLIPGIGDSAGMLLSGWIVLRAAQRDVPHHVLLRMMANLFLDTVIGSIPILGDLFDFTWKANNKNVELLLKHSSPSSHQGASSLDAVLRLIKLGLLSVVILFISLLGLLGLVLAKLLF